VYIVAIVKRFILLDTNSHFCGEFSNSFILAKMKIWSQGRWLWTRTIGSTLVGELVDSLLFIVIAFAGVLPNSLLATLIISNYIFKTSVEILFTPFTYQIVKFLKTREQEDYYDYKTNFNPFKAGE